MAITDAKQFNGTRGSAKEIVDWIGTTPSGVSAVFGSTYLFDREYTDDDEAGLNLLDTVNGAPFYHTVHPTEWVAKTDTGEVLVYTDAQLRAVFTPPA